MCMGLGIDSSPFTARTAAVASGVPFCKSGMQQRLVTFVFEHYPMCARVPERLDCQFPSTAQVRSSQEPPDPLVGGTHCTPRHCPWTHLQIRSWPPAVEWSWKWKPPSARFSPWTADPGSLSTGTRADRIPDQRDGSSRWDRFFAGVGIFFKKKRKGNAK